MESAINLESVYITDLVGVFILVLLLVTQGWKVPTRKTESRILLGLIISSIVNCLVDLMVFALDGKPGNQHYTALMLGNTYLYLYMMIIGIGIIYFVVKHIDHKTQGIHIILFWILLVIEAGLLIVNFFEPIVFRIDEYNRYQRGYYYILFVILAYVMMLYGCLYYFVNKFRIPTLRYFPVYQFILPILIGNSVQMLHYGISLIPLSFVISFMFMASSLQNEYIRLDKLTGVYNRFELDKSLMVRKFRYKETIAVIMLNLNDFKTINQKFSHDEGDRALIDFANILTDTVGNEGIVVRFSGDEFCIFIRKANRINLNEYKNRLRAKIDIYNQTSGKPYKLSAAIGGKFFDLSHDNGDDLLRQVDALMRVDKAQYYAELEQAVEK